MNGALMQDQWEAGGDWFDGVRQLATIPPGYVPVPAVVIENRSGFEVDMLVFKEDE